MRKFYKLHGIVLAVAVCLHLLVISCQCSAKNTDSIYIDPLAVSEDSAIVDISDYKVGDDYIINDTIDLQGETLYLPDGICIKMKKGVFKNGCIVGSNTRLEYKNVVFDRVHIKGSWIVPHIITSMFKDLSYDNSLKDVFALANPQVENQICIEKGSYHVTAYKSSLRCLTVESNTKVVLNGELLLTPNDFANYSILYVTGNNISISGNGIIVGDKYTHKGTNGEWGMGVYISGCNNISIKGLTIKNCWGDCIYINRNSSDVLIEDCFLDDGRRQGVSVISARNVFIRNCKISNVGGTPPEYAIDVEPNEGDTVRHVTIEKVDVNNCRGGFLGYGKAPKAVIDTILIKKCKVTNTVKSPMAFVGISNVMVDDCKILNYTGKKTMSFRDVGFVEANRISVDGNRLKQINGKLANVSIENVKQLRIK